MKMYMYKIFITWGAIYKACNGLILLLLRLFTSVFVQNAVRLHFTYYMHDNRIMFESFNAIEREGERETGKTANDKRFHSISVRFGLPKAMGANTWTKVNKSKTVTIRFMNGKTKQFIWTRVASNQETILTTINYWPCFHWEGITTCFAFICEWQIKYHAAARLKFIQHFGVSNVTNSEND